MGTYGAVQGSNSCVQCPSGEFAATTGNARCEQCNIGEYTALVGSTGCKSCIGEMSMSDAKRGHLLMTTGLGSRASDSCVCPKGYRRLTDAVSGKYDCKPCEDGLYCPVGSDHKTNLGTLFKVRPGYFSQESDDFDKVYQCDMYVTTSEIGSHEFPDGFVDDGSKAAQRCPNSGGTGAECAKNREGLMCSQCAAGHYTVSTTQECASCSGESVDAAAVWVVLILFLAFPFLGHLLWNSDVMTGTSTLTMAIPFGILITGAQMANVITKLSLGFPSWLVEDYFEMLKLLAVFLCSCALCKRILKRALNYISTVDAMLWRMGSLWSGVLIVLLRTAPHAVSML